MHAPWFLNGRMADDMQTGRHHVGGAADGVESHEECEMLVAAVVTSPTETIRRRWHHWVLARLFRCLWISALILVFSTTITAATTATAITATATTRDLVILSLPFPFPLLFYCV